MTTVRKWWKQVLAIVILLLAAQVCASVLVRTHRVHGYLVAHLERSFGRPVQVGHFGMQLLPSPSLDAENITIGEDPAFGYEYFLRAERLSARFRWTGLLRGHFEFGTLSFVRPSLILVRNAQGRWNLERWLPPAKVRAEDAARQYGPAAAAAPTNSLQKINFDEGRVNFKNLDDKLPFAFINVTGSVEQVSSGRWQLLLEAEPWRSGVLLQSMGTLHVRGDIAGTSARLRPAEISVHWDEVSLADLFRLFRGQDYGVRGTFYVEATAKIGALPTIASSTAPPDNDWTFAVHARSASIHRWDLSERSDNPRLNASISGKWNVVAGNFRADEMILSAPGSNLRGTASLTAGAAPLLELRVDSAGIQAADLLAWYRAFHPGVAPDISVEQYFTGGMRLRGWPLELEDAAFSSSGGTIRFPSLNTTLRVGEVRGGRARNKFVIEPARIVLSEDTPKVAETVNASSAIPAKRRPAGEARNSVDIGFAHDFDSHSGAIGIDGHLEKASDALKIAAAFGRTINHGWELAGPASAQLQWGWGSASFRSTWNGRVDLSGAELQAAGLNLPLRLDTATLEWRDNKRKAVIGKAEGFGGSWSGNISEMDTLSADGAAKWRFDLQADSLDAADLDRWVGPRARPGWLQRLLPSLLGGSTPSVPASELVRRVNAEGELRVGELTIEKLKLGQVRVRGSLQGLQLEITDSQAQWAGGSVHTKVRANFLPRPTYDVTAELEHIDLAQLPSADATTDRLGGLASGNVHLTTAGVGREELLRKLAGSGQASLKNIEFRGWDLGASVRDGLPLVGNSHWTQGQGRFTLLDGAVHVETLHLDEGKEKAELKGDVSFAKNADLKFSASVNGKRISGGADTTRVVKISGPLGAPSISVETRIQ